MNVKVPRCISLVIKSQLVVGLNKFYCNLDFSSSYKDYQYYSELRKWHMYGNIANIM